MTTKIITSLALHAIILYSAQAQNLIINGSFESPQIGANTAQIRTPDSWQTDGSSPALENSIPASGYPLAQDGNQYIDLGCEGGGIGDGVSQSFHITNGGPYLLTWFDAVHVGYGSYAPYSVHILDQASVQIVSTNLDADHGTNWVLHSIPVNLAPGAYTLIIRGEPPPGHVAADFDNVSLQPDISDLLATIQLSVTVCWPGRTNQMYQVQYQTTVNSTAWSALGGPVLGTGTNCLTDLVSDAAPRFYRIVRAP
jgi:hypothetical protein